MSSDPEDRPGSPKPRRLKTLACSVNFPGGNNLLQQFVLDHSDPKDSRAGGSYTTGVLLSMSELPSSVVNALNADGHSALHLAVQKGNPSLVKKLLTCLPSIDVDVMSSGLIEHTPLHMAAGLGYSSIIRELLDKGASTDALDGDRKTALCIAAESGHLDAVKLLVGRGASVSPVSAWHAPLCRAARSADLAAVEFLVSSGADVNSVDGLGNTPLSAAARGGSLEIVEFLVDKGARVDVADADGSIPLHEAVSPEIATFLLDHGADLRAEDMYGTALHNAVRRRNLETVKFLTGRGADLMRATDAYGRTPLHCAAIEGHADCAEFLIDRGADFSEDQDGWTPLHYAAYHGHADVTRMLVDRGADVDATNNYGLTPRDFAEVAPNRSCIEILERARVSTEDVTVLELET